jgi:hypothetical protein
VLRVLLRNDNMIGNSLRYNIKGRLTSLGAISIRGMSTISPRLHSDSISAVME